MIRGKFLLPYYNPHAYPILDCLNEFEDLDLVIGLYYPTEHLRPGYKWPEPDTPQYRCLWKDEKLKNDFLNNRKGYDFFGSLGVFQNIDFYRFAANFVRTGKPYFLMSEGLKYKGLVNNLIRKAAISRINRSSVTLLAIGKGCTEDYRSIGASKWNAEEFTFTSNAPIIAPVQREKGAPLKIVFVGQLIERKNLKVLIKAMEQLKEYDLELTIVGDGASRESLMQQVRRHNLTSVKLAGQMPHEEVFEVMKHSDVLVLPSFYDGWGAVVNEAMCLSNVVVVSSGVRASSAVVNGVNGYVFDPNNHIELAGILKNLTSDKELVARIKAENHAVAHRFTKEYLAQLIRNNLPY